MTDQDVAKLVELFKTPVKEIKKDGTNTIIYFENGEVVPLQGEEVELNQKIPACNFCGFEGDNDHPLFTTDDISYICVYCTKLSMETYIKNGVNIELDLSDSFPNAAEQINNITKNINNDNNGS